MSFARRQQVVVTTNSSGDATAYTAELISGPVYSIHYTKTDFATGVDFAITSAATGQGLWTENNVDASASRAPRQAVHGADGVARLYAAGGTGVSDLIHLAGEAVKIVISNGGDTKTGTFTIIHG